MQDLSPTVTVDLNDPKWSFLRGHTVGDAILFPAAGYLYLAWNIFADKHGVDLNSFPVQFSSVNFRRMTFVDASQPNTFRFNLLHESEHFEIHEGGELVVQGKLAKLAQFPTDAFGQPDELNSARKPSILTSSEFYKEATLRGFNFSGDFRSIQKIDAHGELANLVKIRGSQARMMITDMRTCRAVGRRGVEAKLDHIFGWNISSGTSAYHRAK